MSPAQGPTQMPMMVTSRFMGIHLPGALSLAAAAATLLGAAALASAWPAARAARVDVVQTLGAD